MRWSLLVLAALLGAALMGCGQKEIAIAPTQTATSCNRAAADLEAALARINKLSNLYGSNISQSGLLAAQQHDLASANQYLAKGRSILVTLNTKYRQVKEAMKLCSDVGHTVMYWNYIVHDINAGGAYFIESDTNQSLAWQNKAELEQANYLSMYGE